jgi:hypothetical protein
MPKIALSKFKPANNLDADLTDLYEIQLFIWVRSTTNCVNSASPSTPSSSYKTLTYIDRAEFSDVNGALSFGGSAGRVAKVLGAVSGALPVKNPIYAGTGHACLDDNPPAQAFQKARRAFRRFIV